MKIGAITDKGKVRAVNEDCFETGELPGGAVWAVVCDGMGGTNGGEIASQIASKTILERINKLYSKEMSSRAIHKLLFSVIEWANSAVFDYASDNNLQGMGTTVVLALIKDNKVFCAHLGDSRMYSISDGKIRLLTKDHSIVQELIDKGLISPAEAANHPQKNIITKALGVDKSINADRTEEPFYRGDILVLCSDGLTNFTDEEDILHLCSTGEPDEWVEKLVSKANENGGGDNITVVAILQDKNGGGER